MRLKYHQIASRSQELEVGTEISSLSLRFANGFGVLYCIGLRIFSVFLCQRRIPRESTLPCAPQSY